MNWAGLSDFISMGGYGLYVWGAYGGALALMAIESCTAVRAQRRAARGEPAGEQEVAR